MLLIAPRRAPAWLPLFVGAAAAALLTPREARAQASLVTGFGGPVNFGTSCLSPNDDGSSDRIDLTPAFPSGLRFFAGTYRSAFVNTNGNITFNAALPTYTPDAFPIADQPMIAPYWADVDVRPSTNNCGGFGDGTGSVGNGRCLNPSGDGVWWHLERGRLVVTWHQVGYYRCHVDHRMNFQMIVTDAGGCGGPGDFDVEFRYNVCDWTTGDASGGTNGFGGTPAQAGFDAGDRVHFFAVPGSLMSDVNRRLCTGSNVGTPGVWHFAIRNGMVTGMGGTQTCGVGACQRTVPRCADGMPLPCEPGPPSPEVCNGIDDDCNGVVDDGQTSCGVGACRRTVPLCTAGHTTMCEPGPPSPEVCNGVDDNCDGTVDEGCTDVVVVDASDDAPDGDDACHAGRCYDPLLLEGRAGPVGACECHAAAAASARDARSIVGALVVLVAGVARRRRRRRPR